MKSPRFGSSESRLEENSERNLLEEFLNDTPEEEAAFWDEVEAALGARALDNHASRAEPLGEILAHDAHKDPETTVPFAETSSPG